MTGSAFVRVPPAAGRNPFRVVRRPEPATLSCAGVQPFGSVTSRARLPRSGVWVTTAVYGWNADPRGDCGACPGCRAVLAPAGDWVAVIHAEDRHG